MSFQLEFNELKSSFEVTVSRNPLLKKEEEFFIFSNINLLKNRLFRICLADDNAYLQFVSIVEQAIIEENTHEIFAHNSFASAEEYDINMKKSIEFALSIKESSKENILELIKDFNISFDIFKEVMSICEESKVDNVIFNSLKKDMEYYINKIYLSNVKIILRILSVYKSTVDLTAKDLFSEGSIGLRRAIELFNCNLRIKFSTYASQWIKAGINRAIADKDSLIRIPVNVREQSKEVEKIKKQFQIEFNRDPEEFEIIDRMKKKVTSLSNLDVGFSYYPIEIDGRESEVELKKHNSMTSFEAHLEDTYILDETDNILIKNFRNVIKEYINSITNTTEKYYLKYHFGVNEISQVKTKEQMINELNILPVEYDRVRKKALNNIKRALGKNKILLDAYSIASGWDSHSNVEF